MQENENKKDENELNEKIPYDKQPITRYRRPISYMETDYGEDDYDESKFEPKKNTSENGHKSLYLFMAILLVVSFILGYNVININRELGEIETQRAVYNLNYTSSSNESTLGASRGILSTVSVACSTNNNVTDYSTFFNNATSLGSGVVLEVNRTSGDATFVTNYHVICNNSTNSFYGNAWIMLWDSFVPIKCTYVGGSKTYDIAVLKVTDNDEIKNSGTLAVDVGDSTEVSFMDQCAVIGNSMGMNLRATTGVVAVEELIMADSASTYYFYMSHSSDVNSGNSGGGLYNYDGKLIGIVNAKFNDTNSSGTLTYKEVVHGMFYALPSSIAISVAYNIIRNYAAGGVGKLTKANIGLVYGSTYEEVGKYVEFVDQTSYHTCYTMAISESTGSFSAGDELISFKYTFGGAEVNVAINRLFSIESHIFNFVAGQTIEFKVMRNNVETTINVTVPSNFTNIN